MPYVNIYNPSKQSSQPIRSIYCTSLPCRFRGLMLSSQIPKNHGLLLVQSKESKIDSAIHMFFMRFDIAVVWIDNCRNVVDVRLAKRWHPLYLPNKPAKYILETHVDQLGNFSIGDKLNFEYE